MARFRKRDDAHEHKAHTPEVAWLAAADNPWPVDVIDLRPFADSMLSTSKDESAARNLTALGASDGRQFLEQEQPAGPLTELSLSYPTDGRLADGVLFAPRRMEHKWAIFHHRQTLMLVRSWTGQVAFAAQTATTDRALQIREGRGMFDTQDSPRLRQAVLDYLVRSHALREVLPAPLPPRFADDLAQAAMWCFSVFGNMARFATPHEFRPPPPTGPLRTISLLHIAVARADQAAAEQQLALGVPIGIVGQDGLTLMHWATTAPGLGMMQWVRDHGLPIDARGAGDVTPLMSVVQANQIDRMEWLLNHGADPSAVDARGFTSLHRAAEMGHADAVRVLLRAGASPMVEADGHTPQSLAETGGHSAIVAMLQDG